jgi:hypothetical protein
MADRSGSSIPSLETLMPSGLGEVAPLARANLEAMVRSQQALLGGVASMQAELLAFAREEAARGLDLQRALAGCASPQQAMELQLGYTRDLAQAWLAQGRKMTEMGTGVARACWAPVEERGEQVVDKVTEKAAEKAAEKATGKPAGERAA